MYTYICIHISLSLYIYIYCGRGEVEAGGRGGSTEFGCCGPSAAAPRRVRGRREIAEAPAGGVPRHPGGLDALPDVRGLLAPRSKLAKS